jgi:hypothetical protein
MSTIGSTTISSNKLEQIEMILKDFLEGRLSLRQIQDALRGYMVIDFDPIRGHREIRNNELDGVIGIPVEKSHLRHALQRYIDGKISETDLSNWAAFVFMAQVYIPQGQTEEERNEAGNGPVWDILQRLGTPLIFDGLSLQVAGLYLDMLLLA